MLATQTALSGLLGWDYRRPRSRAEPVNARTEGSGAASEVCELNADGGIFLSYRREETGHVAGRLADRLIARFGEPKIFMDVDSIPLGADFIEIIQHAVRGCDILLVLIGPQWTKMVNSDGRRRLDDSEDFVVLEVREALDRSIPVVPILVDGAPMPRREDLPAPLQSLARRNAVRVDAESFRSDVSGLLEHLTDIMPEANPAETATRPTEGGDSILSRVPVSRRTALRAAVGAAAAAIALTGVGIWGRRALLRPPAPVWTFETGGEIYSSPTVVGGLLYIGSSDSNLYALDARTGNEQWRYSTGGAVTSSPIVVDGTVYVGSNDSHLHAVDAAAAAEFGLFLPVAQSTPHQWWPTRRSTSAAATTLCTRSTPGPASPDGGFKAETTRTWSWASIPRPLSSTASSTSVAAITTSTQSMPSAGSNAGDARPIALWIRRQPCPAALWLSAATTGISGRCAHLTAYPSGFSPRKAESCRRHEPAKGLCTPVAAMDTFTLWTPTRVVNDGDSLQGA